MKIMFFTMLLAAVSFQVHAKPPSKSCPCFSANQIVNECAQKIKGKRIASESGINESILGMVLECAPDPATELLFYATRSGYCSTTVIETESGDSLTYHPVTESDVTLAKIIECENQLCSAAGRLGSEEEGLVCH